MTPGTSSFADFLAAQSPDLLPSRRAVPQGHAGDLAPHGTTIVAATFPGGVVMAGDRRATMGNIIAQRDIEKVFPADEYSCVGIAGTAGLAVELVRLFQTELEHYEKIEGMTLSHGRQGQPAGRPHPRQPRDGHARSRDRAAVRGLRRLRGPGSHLQLRRHGGRYEETAFYSVGSGSLFARGALKKLYRADLAESDCVTALSRRCTTPPTTTRRPAAPTSPGGSSRSCRWSPPRAAGVSPTPRSRRSRTR